MSRTILALGMILATAASAEAACRIKTAKCVEIPPKTYSAPYAVGDTLPKGSFEVLLNVRYHGLPPSDGSFWYVRSGRHVYKIVPRNFEVIDDVTQKARRLAP